MGHVEAPARLTIHSHPKFIVTPQDKVVGVGRAVSLRCQVHGNPPPNVFWNKDTGQVSVLQFTGLCFKTEMIPLFQVKR